MSLPAPRALAAALLLAACAAPRHNEFLPPPEARPVVQSLLGASFLDESQIVFEGVSEVDPSALASVDYDTLPAAGISGMQPITQGTPHLGLEGSLLVSWWVKEADVYLPGGGTIVLDVDTALWLTELSIGPYISTSMNAPVRFYAGAGASMQAGFVEFESSDELEEDGSAFGVGGYARAGLELLLGDGGLLGVGVRSVHADLDFDSGLPDVDLDALQVFVTYSAGSGPFFAPPNW